MVVIKLVLKSLAKNIFLRFFNYHFSIFYLAKLLSTSVHFKGVQIIGSSIAFDFGNPVILSLTSFTTEYFFGWYTKASIKGSGGVGDFLDDNLGKKKESTYKTVKYTKQKKEKKTHMDKAMKGAFETMGVMGIIPF